MLDYWTYTSPYRNMIVGVDTKVPLSNGEYSTYINFDNAATTPPFVSVLKEIIDFSPWYSSINRGKGYKSQISSNLYENSRKIVLNFVKADEKYNTVIYVKNTTEGINKLSYRLCDKNNECVILSTSMEHHSNDLPWRDKYKLDYIKLDKNGRLSMEDLEQKLINYKGHVKLVTISGASNVTGFLNPIYDVARLAHQYGAKILVDGAQLVPHVPMDMKNQDSLEHIDFLVFSAHKMYAPFGIGVLIGPKEIFKKGEPHYKGGGTVDFVTHDYVIWNDPPNNEEAGTPNVMGVVALVAAINTLNQLGMNNIESYENSLLRYAVSSLKNIEDVELYGDLDNLNNKVAIIPFNIKGIHHSKVAEILSSKSGIAVRTGCFCAQPYVQELLNISKEETLNFIKESKEKRPGMIRASFGLYNSFFEIDYFINVLKHIVKNKNLYIN
jgi:selenocysteine lyase/cysteine desulfurase